MMNSYAAGRANLSCVAGFVMVSSVVVSSCGLGSDAGIKSTAIDHQTKTSDSDNTAVAQQVSIEQAVENISLNQAIPVRVSVYNARTEALSFLPMNSAFEDPLQADVFEVYYDGERQPYLGIKTLRLAVTADDFVTLAPANNLRTRWISLRHMPWIALGTTRSTKLRTP